MVRGMATGGSSLIYCGTATRPADFIEARTGIDLQPLADQFIEELGVAPLPDSLVGESAVRIMESAQALGLDWQLLPKFIDPAKCVPNCGECMLGCRREAKFTARRFVNQARELGLVLRPRTRVGPGRHRGRPGRGRQRAGARRRVRGARRKGRPRRRRPGDAGDPEAVRGR